MSVRGLDKVGRPVSHWHIKTTKLPGIAHHAWPAISHRYSIPPIVRAHQAPEVGQSNGEALMMHIGFIIRTSCLAVLAHFSVLQASAQTTPEFVNQGPNWTAATRADFYSRDQGSRMIPLAWLRALKQPNGQPFLSDSLVRYGYLPNPANSDQLPVGFTASGPT